MPVFNRNDVRHQPAYTLAEAARYLKLPQATLRAWTVGRDYPVVEGQGRFKALIKPASGKPPLLSFYNLIEAHVLRALRTGHGVSIKALRDSIAYAERTLRVERLLLSEDLRTHGGRVLLDHYGTLIDLSASGQIAIRKALEDHLERIEWDAHRFPVRLYPYPTAAFDGRRPIAIDANIAFGRPVIVTRGVSTHAITERLDAGESVAELAADYDLAPSDIEQAALYERAALTLAAAHRVVGRVYFTDRDLGKRFPARLRASGLHVEWFFDHFGDTTPDTKWLGVVGNRRWIVVTHDERIRYKANELAAVVRHRVAMLLVVGHAPFPTLAEHFVHTLPRIEAFVASHEPPYIAKVLRPTPKDLVRSADAPGTISLWYPPRR